MFNGGIDVCFVPQPDIHRRSIRLLGCPLDRFDAPAWNAGGLADRAVLPFDKRACGNISIQAAHLGRRDLAIRCSRAVFVDNVEKHEPIRELLLFGQIHTSTLISCEYRRQAFSARRERLSAWRNPIGDAGAYPVSFSVSLGSGQSAPDGSWV